MKALTFLVFKFLLTSSYSELVAIYSRATIPLSDASPHVVTYDGDDSVYVLGGRTGHPKKILKYSLSSDTVHWEGSLPLEANSGSVHSDRNGNLYYFGADHQSFDKILRYSPLSNSTAVVAQLPHFICGSPSIKTAFNTVLILGTYFGYGGPILSFDLEAGTITTLSKELPFSLSYGAAVRFGKDKAFLFPYGRGAMWEMDLVAITFTRIFEMPLPKFNQFPVAVRDASTIFIFATFDSSPEFPDGEGLLQIDPLEMTSTFLHVQNWPRKNGKPSANIVGVFVPKMNRIYSFVSRHLFHVAGKEERERAEIFYVDFNPVSNQVTGETSSAEKSTTSVTEISTETLTTFTEGHPIPDTLPVEYKFGCSSSVGVVDVSYTCTSSQNHNGLDVFCGLNFSQVVTCSKVSPSHHLILNKVEDGKSVQIKLTPIKDNCDFGVTGDLRGGTGLHCLLMNGLKFTLVLAADIDTPYLNYVVIGLLLTLGVFILLVTAWGIKNYKEEKNKEEKKSRTCQTVLWEADKDCKVTE